MKENVFWFWIFITITELLPTSVTSIITRPHPWPLLPLFSLAAHSPIVPSLCCSQCSTNSYLLPLLVLFLPSSSWPEGLFLEYLASNHKLLQQGFSLKGFTVLYPLILWLKFHHFLFQLWKQRWLVANPAFPQVFVLFGYSHHRQLRYWIATLFPQNN